MAEPKKNHFHPNFCKYHHSQSISQIVFKSWILHSWICFKKLFFQNFYKKGKGCIKKQPKSAPSCFFTYFLPSHFTTIFYEYVIMKIFWLAEDFLPSLELFELAQENMDIFFLSQCINHFIYKKLINENAFLLFRKLIFIFALNYV